MDEESITLELEQLPWFIELEEKRMNGVYGLFLKVKIKQDLLKCIGQYQ